MSESVPEEQQNEHTADSESIQSERRRFIPEWVGPVALAVSAALLIRSFVVQAYEIPSGSMIPTLLIGDQLIVNKLAYGVKMPFSTERVTAYDAPDRGDIVVFQYPIEPDIDFIKRVIGLPGDRIAWKGRQIIVNGVPVPQFHAGQYDYDELSSGGVADQYIEVYGGRRYTVLYRNSVFAHRYDIDEFVVPEDHYYMIGDNRDNSNDSRRWGFVHKDLLRGPAVVIHFSWHSMDKSLRTKRIGRLIN